MQATSGWVCPKISGGARFPLTKVKVQAGAWLHDDSETPGDTMGRKPFGQSLPILAWLALALLLVASMPVVADSTSDESTLRNLVLQDCGSCHGMTLGGGLGPSLKPAALQRLPVEAIAAVIREGVPGTAMPPWKALLSEPEIRWVSERLKSGELLAGQND